MTERALIHRLHVAKTLQTLTEVVSDVAKRSAYLVKLGLLYSDKLEDNKAAIRTWASATPTSPSGHALP